ncbi:hypothetical protein HYDPIDRAFT_144326 [Hydnomerulius pinastri MD-312]|nr:hypothetical protein HYDPIDRAFT_144326 [Hydnomerulius pinastri MD-312]
MPRELRQRKSRPNYSTLAGYDDDEAALPPKPHLTDEEDSGSDFAPDKIPENPQAEAGSDSDVDGLDADGAPEEQDIEVVVEAPKRSRGTAGKAKAASSTNITATRTSSTPALFAPSKSRKEQSRRLPPKMQQGTSMASVAASAPPLTAPRTAKMYALPNPSAHHRHRAVPLYLRKDKVERLVRRPSLFEKPEIVPTNSMTADQSLTDRISKAWGYNVGAGPVWEVMEDRSCFKEAFDSGNDAEDESLRRPRVHKDVEVRPEWEVLSYQDASKYLPTDTVTTDDGQLKPPSPVSCYLGPYGQQTQVTFNMFDSCATSKYFKDGKSYVLNAGSPVWGIDWCPTHPDDRPARKFKQYLAIAPFPSRSHSPSIGAKASRPSPACVQIWALQPRTADENEMDEDDPGHDPAEIRCEMVLCLEGGPAQEIKWCPLPAHDLWDDARPKEGPRKLGILAGTFEDGSLSIYVVPDPEDVRPPDHDSALPVFVKLSEPTLRIELEGTSCWSLDWANSEVISVGCTNGCIAVYDIGKALANGDDQNILPTHFISVHQSAIRALAWVRVPPTDGAGIPAPSEDPTIIASGGYDGVECLTDIREPHGNVVNRTRDVINSTTYSAFAAGPVMIDHDNTVKAYSISPSMLGRGHVLMEPDGPVWSVNASDYHPQLAVGSADGSCVTTNMLKSTRRSGAVPFFIHKIYQLDYSRKTGEFRMLEQFLPQVSRDPVPTQAQPYSL